MSELEKIRAASFLSILTIALVVLAVLQARGPEVAAPARESLEVCAASKGALCDDAVAAPTQHAREEVPAALGQTVVAAQRDATMLAAARAPVGFLGEMTVVADPLPLNRFAELEASRAAAVYLATLREPAIQSARLVEF